MKQYLLISTLLFVLVPMSAEAFTAPVTPGQRTIYLRIGDGAFTGNLQTGGSPQNSGIINTVSVTVPALAVGTSTPQLMTSNATQATSFWDGYAFCNLPNEVYIGGFFRRQTSGAGGTTAVLSVSFPTNLVNANGDTIPFSQISWTSSGNGDTGTQIIPAGSFNVSPRQLSTWTTNTWNESCHRFSYANTQFVGSGTYTGRAVYTLVAP